MLNKIDSNCSFRMELRPLMEVRDIARFNKINNLVRKSTTDIPKRVLYMLRTSDGKLSVHTNVKKCKNHHFFVGEEICTDTLEKHMETMSDKEIADKFVVFYKILSCFERIEPKVNLIKKQIKDAKLGIKDNSNKAKLLYEDGNRKFAQAYEVLARRKQSCVNTLKEKLDEISDDFLKMRSKYAKKYPEVMQIESPNTNM